MRYSHIGVLNIFGDTISPLIPPFNDIKLKSQEAQQVFNTVGNILTLVWGSRNTYRWGGNSDTDLRSMNIPVFTEAYRYDGRMFFIVNDSVNDSSLTIYHLEGTGNAKFSFPDSTFYRKG